MQPIANTPRLVVREDRKWEHVVMAEVLVPDVANVYGDFWTRDSIKQAAYMFMERGFGLDIEHDRVDHTGEWFVVESFIVRAGDPDFIEGSWVVGVRIHSSKIWDAVLNGDINGFSYEALVEFIEATLYVEDDGIRQGVTEPDPVDGHTHEFAVIVGPDNRPTAGGTSETNGHSHGILTHTVTQEAAGHVHRFNIIYGKEGL